MHLALEQKSYESLALRYDVHKRFCRHPLVTEQHALVKYTRAHPSYELVHRILLAQQAVTENSQNMVEANDVFFPSENIYFIEDLSNVNIVNIKEPICAKHINTGL